MRQRLFLFGLALLASSAAASNTQVASALVDLSLEELSNIRVTSVSRRAEPLATAAASVFVITGEDIRRAGAITIMEALRLAPNLQVARSASTGYAITARGFYQTLANKLLVLIDGRTVYSPFFAGVFWDAQDVPLEDVERIEVISGPGGTHWGANAVNGVINIVTKSAAQTQGTLLSATGGDEGNKAMVQMHGGSVSAHSEGAGKGTLFTVTLPASTSRVVEPNEARSTVKPGAVRVLVADDNEDAAESLAAVLRLAGHDVRVARDGQEAVELAAAFRLALALLDIGMPRMNGYEAAQRIRTHEGGTEVLLIAVTGLGAAGDRRRAFEAGFDHHLTKPRAARGHRGPDGQGADPGGPLTRPGGE